MDRKRQTVPDKGAKPMFRKWLFSGVVSLGLLTSTAVVPSAQAHDRDYDHHRHHHYDHHYAVIYRDFWHGPWRVYGVFHSPRAAHETAEGLRFRGINARVVYR